jgi:hypothetical protein
VLGASAGTGRFQPGIRFIIVYEIFHLSVPFLSVGDALLAADDFVLSLDAVHRPWGWHDVECGEALLVDAVSSGTNSSCGSILLIHHFSMQAI